MYWILMIELWECPLSDTAGAGNINLIVTFTPFLWSIACHTPGLKVKISGPTVSREWPFHDYPSGCYISYNIAVPFSYSEEV